MFKVVEKPTRHQRTFKTWAGCFEHMRLLARQGRRFTVYEKKGGKWCVAD